MMSKKFNHNHNSLSGERVIPLESRLINPKFCIENRIGISFCSAAILQKFTFFVLCALKILIMHSPAGNLNKIAVQCFSDSVESFSQPLF